MQTSLRKFLPPRFFGLSPRARDSMRIILHDKCNKTMAKKEYTLREKDFEGLPVEERENPMDPNVSPCPWRERTEGIRVTNLPVVSKDWVRSRPESVRVLVLF